MAKKKESAKASTEPLGESAHRIWLAGLGALSVAEEEGSKLFRQLVEKGESFRGPVRSPLKSARGQVKDAVEEVRGRAGRTVDRIETVIDDRIQGVLERLGLPSKGEIAELTARVERLTRAVEAGGGGTARRGKATPKKKSSTSGRTVKKAATKTAKTAKKKSAGSKKKTTRRS